MKQYKVEITKEALQDMEDIYNYIAIDLLASENAIKNMILTTERCAQTGVTAKLQNAFKN